MIRFVGTILLVICFSTRADCQSATRSASQPRELPSAISTASPLPPPSLIVLITIDQFRDDYLDRFGPQLHGGLARLSRGRRLVHERAPRPRDHGNRARTRDTSRRTLPSLDRHHGEPHWRRRPGRSTVGRWCRDARRVAEEIPGHDARRLATREGSAVPRTLCVEEGIGQPFCQSADPKRMSTGTQVAASRRADTIVTPCRTGSTDSTRAECRRISPEKAWTLMLAGLRLQRALTGDLRDERSQFSLSPPPSRR